METLILSADDSDLYIGGEIIRNGGLVGIPTETVYGLAANALDGQAVKRIYEAKGRPSDNPLIVHICELSQWDSLVTAVPDRAKRLADAFWPGPLTVILPKSGIVPNETSGGLDTVAVRMPSNETARKFIEYSGVPIAAPSANTSGMPSPTCASHVINDLFGKIDAIIDGGECSVGVESTVVSLTGEVPVLLRPGGITPQMLESVLGEIRIAPAVYRKPENGIKAESPGMKYRHYSPKAKVILIRGGFDGYRGYVESHKTPDCLALCFDGEEKLLSVRALSYGGENDSVSQAKRIFAALREADDMGADTVFARYPNDGGVGLAVYNRLIRAAGFEVTDV